MEAGGSPSCPAYLLDLLRISLERLGEDAVRRLVEKSCRVHQVSARVCPREVEAAIASCAGITVSSRLGHAYVPPELLGGARGDHLQLHCVHSVSAKAPLVCLRIEECQEDEGWNSAPGRRRNRGGAWRAEAVYRPRGSR
jgi:hypothetical protein